MKIKDVPPEQYDEFITLLTKSWKEAGTDFVFLVNLKHAQMPRDTDILFRMKQMFDSLVPYTNTHLAGSILILPSSTFCYFVELFKQMYTPRKQIFVCYEKDESVNLMSKHFEK